ncbi:MAG: sugar phosphate isomerase/epimerase [Cytophagales bacterium]|nr:sugar phosphate isomerase/epimerase [Armatimonadota bacterium]
MDLTTMPLQTPLRISVSSWALHSLIGQTYPGRPEDPDADFIAPHAGTLDLLDVPAALAACGITTMEVCHFHLPAHDTAYLDQFKSALTAANVELWNLLIDDGDIAHPLHGARDAGWVLRWMDVAGHLGARCVRVIAGKQEPTPGVIAHSSERLMGLMVDAYLRGLHVMTENWYQTASRPGPIEKIIGMSNGTLGLCLDFGNWGGDTKYADYAAIAPFATSCHAKCNFSGGKPDADDFRRCLLILRDARYQGPFTLVHGESGAVWESLETQQDLLREFLDT